MSATNQLSTSVVICAYTRERWPELQAAIQSVREQTRTAHEIILVIDHNPELLHEAQTTFEEVIVCENAQDRGVSGARNTGIARATGTLVAFLDDDATAAPDWLEHMCAPLDEPRVLGTGGYLSPAWQGRQPGWFPDEFLWVVGCSYRGLPETSMAIRNPIGGSFCMRRAVFEGVGGFQTQMGRVGTLPLGCEETELSIRARRRWPDGQFIFTPRAKVFHKVPIGRATWKYFRARCYAEGLSKANLTERMGSGEGLASERTYVVRTLPLGVLRGLSAGIFRRDTDAAARAAAIVAGLTFTTWGYIVGRTTTRMRAGATQEVPATA